MNARNCSPSPRCAVGARAPASPRADDANQRRGRDVPVPDLLEVVQRVQQAAPERRDQLPVDRVGRRHPPGHEPDGVLRRHRRPDDQRAAAGRAGQDPALPDRARRRRAGLQHPRRDRRAEVHRAGARRHLPRQDHQVERPGDREAEPGRQPARHRHHRRAPVGRLGHDATSGSTTSRRCRRSGRRRSASRRPSTGRSVSAARATRAWPGS